MAAEKQVNMIVSKDVLCAKLFEIVEHTTDKGKINLKCDVCCNNAVVVLCKICNQCLCNVCYKQHSEENYEHDIVILDRASVCPEHNKSIEYYCEKCDEFACCSCRVKHSSTDDHNLGKIEEISLKYKNFLAEIAAPIDEIDVTALSQIKAKLLTAQKRLEEQLTEVEQSIDSQYKVQFEKMKERHDLLRKEVTNVVSQKKKALLVHLDEVNSTQNEVKRLKKLFDDLKTASGQETISTNKQFMQFHVQKTVGKFNNVRSKPVESDLITFDPIAESADSEILGHIITDNRYPSSIEVIRSQDAPTKIINCNGKMGTPRGIAFARTGMWAVTDNDSCTCCVYIFNSQNQLVHKFGHQGRKKDEFIRPFGVAFDSNNHLYVVDGGTHTVKKFDTNGKFLLQFGKKGNGDGELNGPYGITTHVDKVYVADFYNKRISVFQTEGQFCFSFGSDQLAGPQDVAINTNDELLFVTDNSNHKIYVFTLNGGYVKEFGRQGISEGELNLPLGITTWNGKILISDKNHRVSIFSEDGEFVRCIGSYGSAEGQLNHPYGIASNLNSIYVADWVNQRVQIFNL